MIPFDLLSLLHEVASIDVKMAMEKTLGWPRKCGKLPPPRLDLFVIKRQYFMEDMHYESHIEIVLPIRHEYPRIWYLFSFEIRTVSWQKQGRNGRWIPNWNYMGTSDCEMERIQENNHPITYDYYDPVQVHDYELFLDYRESLFIHYRNVLSGNSDTFNECILYCEKGKYRAHWKIFFGMDKRDFSLKEFHSLPFPHPFWNASSPNRS